MPTEVKVDESKARVLMKERGLLAAMPGSAAEICLECGCKYPGHKINCVTDNERARKAQAALSARYANRRRRNRKQPNNYSMPPKAV